MRFLLLLDKYGCFEIYVFMGETSDVWLDGNTKLYFKD
jgi:hypothetical protein